jgi:hypothetical protein
VNRTGRVNLIGMMMLSAAMGGAYPIAVNGYRPGAPIPRPADPQSAFRALTENDRENIAQAEAKRRRRALRLPQ